MNVLNKAIKNIDEPLFNRIRAKVAQGNRTDISESAIKKDMESTIIKVLNVWATPKNS